MSSKCDYGPVFWIRFAEWCAARKLLLTYQHKDAAQLIRDEFNVSRATSYRWLSAWREVHPTIEGETA